MTIPKHCEVRLKNRRKYFLLLRAQKKIYLCYSISSTFCSFQWQGEKLRTSLIALYFNPEEIPFKSNKDVAKKKKEDDSAAFLYRANKTLFDMQCMMDVNGATDLCIDLIMAEPNPNIFLECIQLAIALLNGGNGAVQVSISLTWDCRSLIEFPY